MKRGAEDIRAKDALDALEDAATTLNATACNGHLAVP
jgi:hypothetical protein